MHFDPGRFAAHIKSCRVVRVEVCRRCQPTAYVSSRQNTTQQDKSCCVEPSVMWALQRDDDVDVVLCSLRRCPTPLYGPIKVNDSACAWPVDSLMPASGEDATLQKEGGSYGGPVPSEISPGVCGGACGPVDPQTPCRN